MAEREQDLKRKPEYSDGQSSNLGEKLSLAHQARQDFSRALQLTEDANANLPQTGMYITIAEAELTAGIDPTPIINILSKKALNSDSIRERRHLYGVVASFQAEMGNINEAVENLRLADQYGEQEQPHVQIDIAIAQAKAGLDPNEMLIKAKAISGKMAMGGEKDIKIVRDDYMKILHLQDIARAQFRVGQDALPTFNEAIVLARKGKHSAYSGIAKDLAGCGYFEQALQVAEQIEPSDHERTSFDNRGVTLWLIASKQITTGDTEVAIETAKRTNRGDVLAHVYAEAAIARAANDENSQEYIAKALEYAKSEKHDYINVDLYAHIGQAQARSGLDASKAFSLAMEKAEMESQADSQAKLYLSIAKNQALGGLDARLAFEIAVKCADKITEDPKADYLDETEQAILYEDIAQTAIDAEYYDIAKSTLEKIDSVWDDNKVKVLARLAREEAKRGLKSEQIEALSKEDVQAILSGNNETAKEAVEYFELNKK